MRKNNEIFVQYSMIQNLWHPTLRGGADIMTRSFYSNLGSQLFTKLKIQGVSLRFKRNFVHNFNIMEEILTKNFNKPILLWVNSITEQKV